MKPVHHTSRRSFLNLGAGAAAALGLSEALAPVALAASTNRAVVCLYLIGGNDSNNMVVPLDAPEYNSYARGRASLALAKDALLPLKGGTSGSYGFHPSLPGLRDLYNQNVLAVVANVGRVSPDRRIAGDASDFTREMQLRYLPNGYLMMPWAVPGTIDSSGQLAMPLAHGVTLATPDANPARRRTLAAAIAAAAPPGRLPATSLGQKFGTVLAALEKGAFRQQAFLVPMDGFAARTARQAELFAEIDEALVGFHRGIAELGMAERVTVYTDTEFNRTLSPNQSGSTGHAWGGHQFVLGGSTLGGQIYGKFPSLELGGADDAVGNGTWTPSTSSAQYAATLAYWYGRTDLTGVPEYAASNGVYQRRLDFLAN